MLRSISIYVQRTLLFAGFAVLVFVSPAWAQTLFPKPLHLTRSVEEPLSGAKATVEEYCFANRVITIRGERTVIVDYEKKEVTEIDREHATYSVTPFDTLANARPHRVVAHAATAKPAITRTRSDYRAGRGVDVFSAEDGESALRAEIAVDNSMALSRDAFDVVVGSAYPNDGGPAADLARHAARRTNGATESYGLPMEQTLRWDAGGGKSVESKNVVTRIGEESAPPDLIAIPPGAKQVDARAVRGKKLGDEIDSLPNPTVRH
jgi:hypothetical protein